MNKRLSIVLFIFCLLYEAFATEIKTAPLAVYDGNGNKTTAPFSPSKAINAELEKHWFEGLVSFANIAETKYGIPVTIIDANKICVSEKSDYLIYGYVKKNETSWFAEIKLYDANEKKIVKEFFAGDSLDNYERFIKVLCQNILSGIEEITGINQDELKQEKTRPMELRIPASLFYWSPIDGAWSDKILGIAGLNAGVEFYPPFPINIFSGKLVDFSTRLNLSWDIGINHKTTYPLVINTVALSAPVFLHVHYNERHSIYAGLGFAYELELMTIRSKHEDKEFYYQNMFSFETTAGYNFNLNDYIDLFAEITFDFHLSGDGFASIKPCLGVSTKVFKEHR